MVTPIPIRNRIIGMHLAGAKPLAIADELSVPVKTTRRIIKQFKVEGDSVPKKSYGRPRKLGPRAIRVAVEIAEEDPRRPFQEITDLLNKRIRATVCKHTVIKAPRKEGYFYSSSCEKIILKRPTKTATT